MLVQDRIADLLADLRSDRVGVRAGQIEHLGIEVPFHPISVEIDRTVEQALVIAPVDRRREGEYHPLTREGKFENTAEQHGH